MKEIGYLSQDDVLDTLDMWIQESWFIGMKRYLLLLKIAVILVPKMNIYKMYSM
jgi:hypothetical protein